LTLAAGTRLGPYEILAPLGAGGMGEVYRARDPKLHRDVAIKVLPEVVARDAERLARFQREAQLLAALNHPHIGGIHGLEDSSGVPALVLELVEGETLAERIAQGPMPVDEALAVARQIGEALEAAHEKGIVHRDLKPANVKLTPGGSVKVLDFGLAKALSIDGSAPDVTHSPTITAAATQAGVVIGTAAYMSPEQARGRAVDKRSDIWSFGVVLYEMLTGRRCFEGETVSDVLAAVLRQDPDWSALPAETPPQVRALLARCLERDPKKRLRDIGDAWHAPEPAGAAANSSSAPSSRSARTLVWVAAVALALAAGFAAARWSAAPPVRPRAPAVHSIIPLPAGVRLYGWASPVLGISRDGGTIAFVAVKEGERPKLWVQKLDGSEAVAVPDSDSAEGPFFSPDGQWVGFAADVSQVTMSGRGGALYKYSLATRLTQLVGPIPDFFGASWADDGSIIVSISTTEGLWRFPADGGKPDTSAESVLSAGKAVRRSLRWPQWIGPEQVLLTEDNENPWGGAAVLHLGTRELEGLERDVSDARCAGAHLLTSRRDRILLAAPFDARRLRPAGPAVAVLREVAFGCNGAAALAVSDSGTLIYAKGYIRGSGADLARIVRVDEKGAVQPLAFEAESIARQAAPSPDGRYLAAVGADGSIWLDDLARQTRSRLPIGKTRAQGYSVVWSPDGASIAYSGTAEGVEGWSIYRQRVGGAAPPETIVAPGEEKYAVAWTPDGGTLVYTQLGKNAALWAFPLDGKTPPRQIVAGLSAGASVSPDGRWLAYDHQDPEGWQTYVTAFAGDGPQIPAVPRGRFPRFSPDGLSFYARRGVDETVRVRAGKGGWLDPSPPEVLFRAAWRGFSVAPDGKGFYAVVDADDSGIIRELHLVTNWFTELEALTRPEKTR
jgi:serine/threonine-protein kinase